MKREQIIEEIKQLTVKIQEQAALVTGHQNKIPQIELDVLQNNIRNLYESLILLNKVNGEITLPEQSVPSNIKNSTDELIASVEVHESAVSHNSMDTEVESFSTKSSHIQPEVILSKVDAPVHVVAEIDTEEEVLQKGTIENKTVKEVSRQQNAAPATLFDVAPTTVKEKFTGSPSVYDKISTSKEDKSLATRHQKNPVSDLKKSIGINEKFAFINELFDGDLSSYNEAIEKLNNSAGHDEAIAILTNDLSDKYGWTEEGESLQKLKTLIDRRFSA